jgi:serine/threonine-protein kinase
MNVKCYQLSIVGPVRDHNEDYLSFWEPDKFEDLQATGSIAALADGVGGETHGEVASRMAVETALSIFQQEKTSPADLARRIFGEATLKILQAAQKQGRMSTTLVLSIFRDNQVTVAHAGDSRAYLIRAGAIKRLTTDHSFTSLPVKLGLVLERNAMTSEHRSTLTRSVGSDLICRYDIASEPVHKGDFILQCSDGLYSFVLDEEILATVVKFHPVQAVRELVALAEKRQASDNISVQIIQVWDVNAEESPAQDDSRPGVLTRVQNAIGVGAVAAPASEPPRSNRGDLGVGSLLDGRFEITDVIARSNMASLFRANDQQTGKAVALKVPLLQVESDAAGFDRFKREEEIGLQLDHPSVLKFYPVEKKSRPYIVMEYLSGETLSDRLRKVHPLPEPEAAKIASRICEAVEYLHQHGIVHRDLKPQNVMLCLDGSLRIMDFGIARAQNARRLTFVGFTPVMGTPDYMAPEQVRGGRGNELTDIYSLGAILYEMATGEPPFAGDSPYVIMNARVTGDPQAPRKVNPALTMVLEEIILHAMERNPKNRYHSAGAMRRELDNYELVETMSRHTRLQSPQVWKSRFRGLPLVAGFVGLQILLFLLFLLYFKHRH